MCLQRHGDRQRPGRNAHFGCLGGSVHRFGRGGGSTRHVRPHWQHHKRHVTQCNGSSNGGGTYAGEPAVGCTVTGADSALPVTINQCNGTSNGGGSAVTCMATVADVSSYRLRPPRRRPQAAPVGPPPQVGPPQVDSPAGAGEQLEQAVRPVPRAEPVVRPALSGRSFRREPRQTGFGGASLSTSPALVYVGGIALSAAGLTMVLAFVAGADRWIRHPRATPRSPWAKHGANPRWGT